MWPIARTRPDRSLLEQAASLIRSSKMPMIVAGGGVLYSEASEALRAFAAKTGIPVAETMAGKGSMRYDDPLALGAVGVTGTPGAVQIAKEADLVIGIGTRYSDFTSEFEVGLAARKRPVYQHQYRRIRCVLSRELCRSPAMRL